MGIRESLLNTITSVGSSDFVRIVTSAGASSKATLQNVIKSFETGLGAKTSLTTSDYIRVVGSDNNLYKQSVSDVADIMLTTFGKTATYTGDLNELAINGYWYCASGATNLPTGLTVGHLIVTNAGTRVLQIFVQYAGDATYMRMSADSGSTWGAWKAQPTRAEIDALNSKTQVLSFEFKVTGGWTAGKTLGGRCAQVSQALSLTSNQYIIGVAIVYIGDSSLYHPLAFVSNNNLYCNYYAASAASCSEAASTVRVRVSYINA